MQPLFIAMGTVSVVSFDIVFIAERWLRHRGKLAPNTSWVQKSLSICATIAAIVGAIGLIILTCLNDLYHHQAHDACLVIFMHVFLQPHLASTHHANKNKQRRLHHLRNLHLLRVPTSRHPLQPAPYPRPKFLDQTRFHIHRTRPRDRIRCPRP